MDTFFAFFAGIIGALFWWTLANYFIETPKYRHAVYLVLAYLGMGDSVALFGYVLGLALIAVAKEKSKKFQIFAESIKGRSKGKDGN